MSETVAFYLYDQNGNLDKRNKIIYSPFNVKQIGRTREEDTFLDPVIFEFVGWVFETDDKNSIEALDTWAKWGGKLSNGRNFYPDQVHKIKRDAPKPKVDTIVNTVEKVVEVQVLPRVVVENMTVKQLQQICESWKIDIPKEIDKGENVKQQIVRILEEGGHVK